MSEEPREEPRATPRPVQYSVVRYRNARTEEDINFGVLIHDPEANRCWSAWDVDGAMQRAGAVFPDFDASIRFILELAARDFPDQVKRHAESGGLEWLSDHHRVCIRVTPPRAVESTDPAREVRDMAEALIPPPVYTTPVPADAVATSPQADDAATVFVRGVLHALGGAADRSEIVAACRRLNAPFEETEVEAACERLVERGVAERTGEGRLALA